eukprot:CAMPEP_0202698244 /NCGR_PEP_ID=MMETSP1385-20130828/11515_1 /ASSEMBLY_ACC=CAM_ASM_000861 /TAXON_ID=933848 /ORGANISM="Elphidium margaritaceum" /LENGTH=872 /DNA_ID=CAMNT_0049354903 /DNA_START=1226 /DNA_END=3844 /DNA_ORIENTATION=+
MLTLYVSSLLLIQSWAQNCSNPGLLEVHERYGDLGGGEASHVQSAITDNCSLSEITQTTFGIAGSATVYPVAKVWGIEWVECQDIAGVCTATVTEGGGSERGASRVCTDDNIFHVAIGGMSRDWNEDEALRMYDNYTFACLDSSRLVTQIPIAIDGITVIVKANGAAHRCLSHIDGLSLAALRWIFTDQYNTLLIADGVEVVETIATNLDGDTAKEWSDMLDHPDCEQVVISIIGDEEGQGTWQYFKGTVFNIKDETYDDSRYEEYLDHEDLVLAVLDDEYAIGYVGYNHYLAFEHELYAVPVADDTVQGLPSSNVETVLPSQETLADGTYPISRFIYMNVANEEFENNDALRDFLSFGFNQSDGLGQDLLQNAVGYTPLSDEWYTEAVRRVEERGNSEMTHFLDRECGDLSGAVDTGFATSGCSNDDYEELLIHGSGTVYPVALLWACNYVDCATFEQRCERLSVSAVSSSSGAQKVCSGEADVGDMSRQLKDTEAQMEADGFTYTCVDAPFRRLTQIQVAVDGITVFVQRGSELHACLADGLTYDQLRWVFSSLSTAELQAEGHDLSGIANDDGDDLKEWSDLSSTCPELEIVIYGDALYSGTQTLVGEQVLNEDKYNSGEEYFYESATSTPVFTEAKDLVTGGVAANPAGIGFAGYANYLARDEQLFAVPLCKSSCDHQSHFVAPNSLHIEDGSYPLARPLYMNVGMDAWSKFMNFFVFGFGPMGQLIISEEVGYVPLSSVLRLNMIARFNGSSLYSHYGATPPTVEEEHPGDSEAGLAIGVGICSFVVVGLFITVAWYGRKYQSGRFKETTTAEHSMDAKPRSLEVELCEAQTSTKNINHPPSNGKADGQISPSPVPQEVDHEQNQSS